MFAQWQRAKARLGGREDSVSDRRERRYGTDLSRPTERTGAAVDQIHFDRRHLRHADNRVIVVIALHRAAAINVISDLKAHESPQAIPPSSELMVISGLRAVPGSATQITL